MRYLLVLLALSSTLFLDMHFARAELTALPPAVFLPEGQISDKQAPQGARVFQDYKNKQTMYERCLASSTTCPNERLKVWSEFVGAIKDEPQNIQVAYVNGWFNRMPYREDDWIYGKADHWADFDQFLQYSGDCEDFSIAKYVTLRALGFAPDQLKIAMVYDVYSGTDHAFLVAQIGMNQFILDNRNAALEPVKFLERYKPHYAFNENRSWVYERPVIARTMREDENAVLPGNR